MFPKVDQPARFHFFPTLGQKELRPDVMTIVRAKSPYGNVQFVLHKCRGTPGAMQHDGKENHLLLAGACCRSSFRNQTTNVNQSVASHQK
ncbi:hypothetical protein QLX08_003878 [Tetragonisca angustula]|uniref:Uncharacterized protein n=1 Tax=Tetragonisca angustula TaxID=166442 RepID=A0AAW1A769_9HYME